MTRTQLKKNIKPDSNIDRIRQSSLGHWDGHTDADAFSVSRAEHPTSIKNIPEPCTRCNSAAPKERLHSVATVNGHCLPSPPEASSVLGCMRAAQGLAELWDLMLHGFAYPKSHNRYPETLDRVSSLCPGGTHGREPDHT